LQLLKETKFLCCET